MNHDFGELRFRPCGASRFVIAGFILVWLGFWALGEAFALFILGNGLTALATGQPAFGRKEPLDAGPALAVGGFLLVWLALWTIGGIAAIRELLRLLWSEDRLSVHPDGLWLTRRLGPFTSRRLMAREEIRRIYVLPRTGALMAQLGANAVPLTTLGSRAERAAAAEQLRADLQLSDEPAAGAKALPAGWEETWTAGGERVVAVEPRRRRQQAWAVTILAGAVSSIVFLMIHASLHRASWWPLTAMAGVFACWLTQQAWRLHRGRKEWRLERGRLVLQRRCGSTVTELAEATALELTESRDSDGDGWYRLEAVLADKPGTKRGRRLTIYHELHDPAAPRALGHYFAEHAGIPFRDLVPDEADRAAELARLADALAATGKFGRWLAGRLKRLDATNDRE